MFWHLVCNIAKTRERITIYTITNTLKILLHNNKMKLSNNKNESKYLTSRTYDIFMKHYNRWNEVLKHLYMNTILS